MSIRSLGNDLQKKAEEELNEVPGRIIKDLQHILEWNQKQPHLNIRTDEQWLLAFLRACKFSLQRTKEKLDDFYTLKPLLPEFCANRDPLLPEIQEILKVGVVYPLPKTNGPTGARVFLISYRHCNPDKITVVNITKTILMMLDVMMLEDDNATVAGIYFWVNYEGFLLNYMLQYTATFMKKCLKCADQAYPLRVKGIYCTNMPVVLETVYNLVMKLAGEKLQSRFKIYSGENFTKIYEDIPQSLLPKEYGGNGGSLDEIAAYWKKKLESYRDWFLEDAKYRSNESLRIGKARMSSDVFEMEGSFRKITID